MNICVIIPTYNEAKAIGGIVKEIISKRKFDVVVVDDGSSDKTGKIASDNGAVVIYNKTNLGKGFALKQGFKYALDNGYNEVITMDGDGQHHHEDLDNFINAAQDADVAIVVGNRMLGIENMPFVRKITNKTMSSVISLVCKQPVPDSQCGFRLIKREVLEKINLKTDKYEIESELLIKAAKLNHKIKSVNIRTIYSGQKSQINPFVDTFRFIKFILKEFFRK
jgi:glycosyltransferase involved in cell wall biosynthesis